MASNVLFVNPKWKRTEIQEALSSEFSYSFAFIAQFALITQQKLLIIKEIQFKFIYDENLQFLDFKCNSIGLCYLQTPVVEPLKKPAAAAEMRQILADYRKSLAKVHNVKVLKKLAYF
jgi:hypothetical protein